VRSFSITRTEGEAGTCTLTLDNRDRAFDPTFVSSPYYPNVRPLNRVCFCGSSSRERPTICTVGYAESYEMQWPGGWMVGCDCGRKVCGRVQGLGVDAATADQPASVYVSGCRSLSTTRASYWTMDEASAAATQPPAIVSQDTTAPAVGEDTFRARATHGQSSESQTSQEASRAAKAPLKILRRKVVIAYTRRSPGRSRGEVRVASSSSLYCSTGSLRTVGPERSSGIFRTRGGCVQLTGGKFFTDWRPRHWRRW